MTTTNRDHAVVLGGSIAGLLAARVLADHYARVTVVERDLLAARPAQRRGVPQAPHAHGLLPRGANLVEALLPGITADLAAAGAHTGDLLADTRWSFAGGGLARADAGLPLIAASRTLLEGMIRTRVRALPVVTIMDGYDIVGLGPSRDGHRIVAARVTSVHGDGSRVLPADLVVDATGRGSRMPRWLTGLGYPAPREDRVKLDLAYTSRVFETPEDELGSDLAVVVSRGPHNPGNGVLQRVEGGRMVVSLSGILGERPPAGLAGFIQFASALATDDIHHLVRAATPVGPPVAMRIPTYARRRYEHVSAFPAGVLVVGDAVCAFSPTFAQGMTMAAIGAVVLGQELGRAPGDPDPSRFFAALSTELDPAWAMTAGRDLSIPGVTGPDRPDSPLAPGYLADVQRAATRDPVVATALLRVSALVDRPETLLRREVVDRVSYHAPVAPAVAYWRAGYETRVSPAAVR